MALWLYAGLFALAATILVTTEARPWKLNYSRTFLRIAMILCMVPLVLSLMDWFIDIYLRILLVPIVLFVLGCFTLLSGAFVMFTDSRRIRGIRARSIGILLMMPLGLALLVRAKLLNSPSDSSTFGAIINTTDTLAVALSVISILTSSLLVITAPTMKGHFLPELLTLNEVAQYLQVNPEDVQQLIIQAHLPVLRQADRQLIPLATLLEYINNNS